MLKFTVLYKGRTKTGSNYFKLLVEIANGIWEEATYFGSTSPKEVTSLSLHGDRWIAQIQKHTSRDQITGQFKGRRKLHA